jgi:hypothetical protein
MNFVYKYFNNGFKKHVKDRYATAAGFISLTDGVLLALLKKRDLIPAIPTHWSDGEAEEVVHCNNYTINNVSSRSKRIFRSINYVKKMLLYEGEK